MSPSPGSGRRGASRTATRDRRVTPRELVRTLGTTLALAGALVLADVAATLWWQEPVTAVVGHLRQRGLAERLPAPPAGAERLAVAELADDRARMAFLARRQRQALRSGEPAARLRIPRLGLDQVVVQGVDRGPLERGPGLYPSQPLPGAPGTAAIAGHRTTYGAPFRHLDRMRPGDPITVELAYGRVRYRVTTVRSVAPDAVWVLDRRREDRLVLTACDPPFSAARRLVVSARLDSAVLARPSWAS
ncbi:class E sortase [Patulibacter brassicae]|jgi:sortase A|uniref:Class E sortase n=1 Tax=Patulibacter brassicae TaxID=1705717 RepID=A0ABU4VIX7_9ACTN|nr:class E sortase [Patulibacter brassicae]MDX8151748.1 class E sortase [Patulibacter brassicae]